MITESYPSDGLRGELAPQLVETETHAAFDGTDRHVEHLGYLRMGESAEVGELDHLNLLLGQRGERRADGAGLVAAGHLDVGPLGRLLQLLKPFAACAPPVVHEVAPQRVDPAVVDDPEQPRADAAALRLVPQAAAPD